MGARGGLCHRPRPPAKTEKLALGWLRICVSVEGYGKVLKFPSRRGGMCARYMEYVPWMFLLVP